MGFVLLTLKQPFFCLLDLQIRIQDTKLIILRVFVISFLRDRNVLLKLVFFTYLWIFLSIYVLQLAGTLRVLIQTNCFDIFLKAFDIDTCFENIRRILILTNYNCCVLSPLKYYEIYIFFMNY